MSNSIVGNNGNPTDCLAWHEVEIGDDGGGRAQAAPSGAEETVADLNRQGETP